MSRKKKKLKEGDIVIVADYSEYRNKYAKERGVIMSVFPKSRDKYIYGVKLDNYSNNASAKGLFWFEKRSLIVETSNIKNDESEENTMYNKIFNNYSVAGVVFLDNTDATPIHYALYDRESQGIECGDIVVVRTGHHGFALAEIKEISYWEEDKKKVKHGREVVCRVDFSEYNARHEAAKRARELKEEMNSRIRDLQEITLLETIAKDDDVLSKMLTEYKSILGLAK